MDTDCELCGQWPGTPAPTRDVAVPGGLFVAISFRLPASASDHIPSLCDTCQTRAIAEAAENWPPSTPPVPS